MHYKAIVLLCEYPACVDKLRMATASSGLCDLWLTESVFVQHITEHTHAHDTAYCIYMHAKSHTVTYTYIHAKKTHLPVHTHENANIQACINEGTHKLRHS